MEQIKHDFQALILIINFWPADVPIGSKFCVNCG